MTSRRVTGYMNPNPISMIQDSPMSTVIQEMNMRNVSHMLLTDNQGNLSGLISKQDLLKKTLELLSRSSGRVFSSKEISATKASDIMTKEYISLKPEDSVEYAIELLLQRAFHCLPVVDADKLVGVVTFSDLLQSYYQEHG